MSLRTANHETLQKFADFPPIREIECFQLFLPQTQAISADALMHMGTEYKKDDAKSTTAIFLNSDILGDNLSVHSYILNRDKEQDFECPHTDCQGDHIVATFFQRFIAKHRSSFRRTSGR